MTSDTLFFLQPVNSPINSEPNFANATGSALFTNYSQSPSGSLVAAELEALVKGGVATAIVQAQASLFFNDPAFSELFTDVSTIGEEGAFAAKGKSATKVVASFEVGANQTFSFDFSADLNLEAKEIDNRDTEYSRATLKTTFVVVDTSDPNNLQIIDYFGIYGRLISSDQVGRINFGSSGHVTIDNRSKDLDIDGNNGIDSITGSALGTYQRTFSQDTQLTIVELNISQVRLAGDTFINNLGNEVIYGTIWRDNLHGTNQADIIYGSLGNDRIQGKKGDDILEGGHGSDRLKGNIGNDKLHGGLDNDILIGGRDSDILVGGHGNDHFVFQRHKSLHHGELDIIKDFQPGIDKIKFRGWGNVNVSAWFDGVVLGGQLIDDQNGVLLSADSGGKILFEGLNVNNLSATDFTFA